MICQSCCHCRCLLVCGVNAAEIEMRDEHGDGVLVVLNPLLLKPIVTGQKIYDLF